MNLAEGLTSPAQEMKLAGKAASLESVFGDAANGEMLCTGHDAKSAIPRYSIARLYLRQDLSFT